MSSVMMGTKDYVVRVASNYIDSEKTIVSPYKYCDSVFIFAYMAGRFPDVPISIIYDAVHELRDMYK